jgi:hypothetical protein
VTPKPLQRKLSQTTPTNFNRAQSLLPHLSTAGWETISAKLYPWKQLAGNHIHRTPRRKLLPSHHSADRANTVFSGFGESVADHAENETACQRATTWKTRRSSQTPLQQMFGG